MDKTNPCIRGQYAKLGTCGRVRTQDRYPIRESHAEKGVRWNEIYDNWEALEEACSTLNCELNRHSKFLVFLGLENFRAFEKLLGLGRKSEEGSVDTREVSLHTLNPGVPFYRQPFAFAVVREKATKNLVQVVWFSYHLQHFFYNYRESPSRYFHDFLWNGICELSHVPIKDPFCFSQSSSSAGSAALSKTRKHGTLATALLMRMYEKGTGKNYAEEEVRHIFRVWIDKDPKLAMATTLPCDTAGSFLAPLLRKKSSQGGKTAGPMNIHGLLSSNQQRYDSAEWTGSEEQQGRSRRMASTMQAYRDQLSLEERKQQSKVRSDAVRLRYTQLSPDADVQAKRQFVEARLGYQTDRKMRQEQQTPNDSDKRLAEGATKGREISWEMKRDKTRAQAKAFLKVLQARHLCESTPASLDEKERQTRDKLLELQQWLQRSSRTETMPNKLQKFFKRRTLLYDGKRDEPVGLRYEGDNCLDADCFPYETEIHPHVRLR